MAYKFSRSLGGSAHLMLECRSPIYYLIIFYYSPDFLMCRFWVYYFWLSLSLSLSAARSRLAGYWMHEVWDLLDWCQNPSNAEATFD